MPIRSAFLQERKAVDAAAAARSRQVAQLCHEMRNPLNGAMGSLTLLQATLPADGDHAESIATAQLCCAQLRRTLDDIVDFDRIAAGKLTIVHRPFNVHDTFAAVISQVAVAAKEKGISWAVDIDPKAQAMLFVSDTQRIQQILANFAWCVLETPPGPRWVSPHRWTIWQMYTHRHLRLLSFLLRNAVKHSPEGGSMTFRVLVQTRPESESEESSASTAESTHTSTVSADGVCWVRFEVEDTGRGIEPALRKRLFQPYEQGIFSRAGMQYGGSGLGLNICLALSKLLQATVGCDAVPPPRRGSIFWLLARLPYIAAGEQHHSHRAGLSTPGGVSAPPSPHRAESGGAPGAAQSAAAAAPPSPGAARPAWHRQPVGDSASELSGGSGRFGGGGPPQAPRGFPPQSSLPTPLSGGAGVALARPPSAPRLCDFAPTAHQPSSGLPPRGGGPLLAAASPLGSIDATGSHVESPQEGLRASADMLRVLAVDDERVRQCLALSCATEPSNPARV